VTLSDLPVGAAGEVCGVIVEGGARRRLMDLGLVRGTRVRALRRSPFLDPTAYLVRGAVIGLRREEARGIIVRPLGAPTVARSERGAGAPWALVGGARR